MIILKRISDYLNQILICIAGLFLIAMIFLTCANVFLRLVWIPVSGTFELMGYFGAVLTAFALGYTQIRRGHIAIDIVVLRFSKKAQRILSAINYIICMVFFTAVAWQIAKYAGTLRETGEVTETLQIIYYPFTYGVAFGCAVLSLVFLVDLLKLLMKKERDEE
ncbi:MAG: TRAP transporter small permease [Desulfobacteraceae bacterium]|uniref:TRAP transporter small permease n=1 Tax=Candidatus Desulfacyla euxinica TaxID=2841693 RepID=A0A8J6T9F8_9DELT|nr:TRAP transporter small permease [Candidatus Desulfacyla euxinica]MBL6978674.1 TRAP transporter small permease [Desulfobacteraceae bacterium]